jgi:hypothetical protein
MPNSRAFTNRSLSIVGSLTPKQVILEFAELRKGELLPAFYLTNNPSNRAGRRAFFAP